MERRKQQKLPPTSRLPKHRSIYIQQQTAAFPIAPSITLQGPIRVFQWPLREQGRSPGAIPISRVPAAHASRGCRHVKTKRGRAPPPPTPIPAERRFRGEVGAELRPAWLAVKCCATTCFTSQRVKLQRDSDAWGKANPGYGVSRPRLERWSALSPLQIETMM